MKRRQRQPIAHEALIETIRLKDESIRGLCELLEHCLDYPELNTHEQRQREFRAAIAAHRRALDFSPASA